MLGIQTRGHRTVCSDRQNHGALAAAQPTQSLIQYLHTYTEPLKPSRLWPAVPMTSSLYSLQFTNVLRKFPMTGFERWSKTANLDTTNAQLDTTNAQLDLTMPQKTKYNFVKSNSAFLHKSPRKVLGTCFLSLKDYLPRYCAERATHFCL